jgi:plastocyanin domain-containing protein
MPLTPEQEEVKVRNRTICIILVGILLWWFFIYKKRDDDEEERNYKGGLK